MIINKIGTTECSTCDTEKTGHEGKLYVSVIEDVSEALASSKIGAGGFKFGGLGLQDQPDGSSVRNILRVHALKRE